MDCGNTIELTPVIRQTIGKSLISSELQEEELRVELHLFLDCFFQKLESFAKYKCIVLQAACDCALSTQCDRRGHLKSLKFEIQNSENRTR